LSLIFSYVQITGQLTAEQYILSTSGSQGAFLNNHSMSWTMGEMLIETGTQSDHKFTQGFHQPILKLTTIQDLQVDLLLEIYPNPATEQLNIQLENFEPGYSFQLYDALGKLLLTEPLLSSNKVIPFNSYSTGLYFLVFTKGDNEKLKTFKIQKSH